ncbi:MAG: class I SAM-dependent methyltransferase [Negativicutes bacterium]|nr:class I SAM-dependent methyltransferase [Negativicutes bacterium]
MNIVHRVKERIRQEGLALALKYAGCASYDTLRCCIRDAAVDFRYSGRLLTNRKTRFSHLGAHDVYHSDYDALNLIFNYCHPIKDDDVLVDVGCGQGRVINYWLSRGLRNSIVGIELDPAIAGQTAAQFARQPNVRIVAGNALEHLPADGTLYYFYNPFAADKVREFAVRLQAAAGVKPRTVLYYNPQSLDAFPEDRWQAEHINFERDLGIKRWGRINKFHELAILTSR